MESPFANDPFSMVWTAFRNLYPIKACECWYDQHNDDKHKEEYGFTEFYEDGTSPTVVVFAEHSISIQVETLAHELAHVAVGIEHDHDEVWETAFEAIFQEYNRIGHQFELPKGE